MITKLLPLYAALAITVTPSACRKPITTVTPTGVAVPIDAPPPSFVRSTSDARTTQVFDVREGVTRPVAFKMLTDAFSPDRYTVDVSDPRAGFVMTTWRNTFLRDGVPDLRYRTRVIARFVEPDWKQLTVHVEANWRRGEEWEVGFDNLLLQEAAAELRLKLGKQ